jgi:hypothetical protein
LAPVHGRPDLGGGVKHGEDLPFREGEGAGGGCCLLLVVLVMEVLGVKISGLLYRLMESI